MATTTNYGWTTPDDTALVKDGASAIRTLGSSVDTTTKALNPSTTLGDLEYRSSTTNTNTRLGIGTTGQVLTVSGGVPAWSTISAGGMTLLSTTTLSSTSTTISSIDGTYTNLVIFVSGVNLSASNVFTLKPNNSGSITDIAGSYRQEGYGSGGFGATDDDIRLDFSAGTRDVKSANTNNFWNFTIFNYANATNYKTFQGGGGYINSNTEKIGFIEGGIFKSNTAISSLVFAAGGATFNAGTVKVYGVK